eukprot:3711065-Amphidinium_carterae.4
MSNPTACTQVQEPLMERARLTSDLRRPDFIALFHLSMQHRSPDSIRPARSRSPSFLQAKTSIWLKRHHKQNSTKHVQIWTNNFRVSRNLAFLPVLCDPPQGKSNARHPQKWGVSCPGSLFGRADPGRLLTSGPALTK